MPTPSLVSNKYSIYFTIVHITRNNIGKIVSILIIAFNLTCIQVFSQGKPIQLVRLFNPWGQGEWIGDWSDRFEVVYKINTNTGKNIQNEDIHIAYSSCLSSSSLWQTISAEDRMMCLNVDDDGEFW